MPAQALLGKTSPPKTQHVGEANTALAIDIAGVFWLAKKSRSRANG